MYFILYIYIYAFSRRFYPKRLTVHSGYTFCIVSMCVPWESNPGNLCAANAMLYHWATGTPLFTFHLVDLGEFLIWKVDTQKLHTKKFGHPWLMAEVNKLFKI